MNYIAMAYGLCLLLGLGLPILVFGWIWRSHSTFARWGYIFTMLWIFVISGLAESGFLSRFDTLPPRMLVAIWVPLIAVIIWAFHPKSKVIIRALSPVGLIGIQAFRIPVEIMLFWMYLGNIFPVQLTFEGRNWDILTGILALPVAWWIAHKGPQTSMIIGFNILGLGLLLNVVVTAVLSMPTPMQVFTQQPDNRMVAEFPWVLLPAVMVALAYTAHIISLRQVFLNRHDH